MIRNIKFMKNSRVAAAKGVSFSANPELKVSLSPWRSRLVLFMLFLAFAGLIARALWLQGISTDFLQKQGESRYARTLELPATRGKILDRNGHVLASSVPVKAIWAIPEDVLTQPKEKISKLAALLGMTESSLYAKLDSDKSFVYLKRQVDNDVADEIVKLGIAGIQTRKEYKRFYPEGEVMAHVVGFTNVEDIGQEGIELASQNVLAGEKGSRRVIKDRLGHIVEDMRAIKEPLDGKDLVLSIDSKLQYIAYKYLSEAVEKHKAKAGSAIVLDTHTGEVLAMVNLPSFNPNDRRHLTGAQLRNRAMTDTFEPGSIMKPFSVALALEKGIVKPTSMIATGNGKLTIGTATIGDTHSNGTISVAQVIEKSSNIGDGENRLADATCRNVGNVYFPRVRAAAPFRFPGAVAGRVRPYKSWRPIEQATMSYGHGISVSLFQIAHSYMIFARNGDTIPLSFLKRNEMPAGQRIVSEKTATDMRQMLEMVTSEHGTARRAQVSGYRVAGKTGTAYKIEGGRYVRKYVGSFVGFAPASDPRVVIAVMIDEPTAGHYGGTVAGPVFSAIAADTLRAMNVAPDAKFEEVLAANKLAKGGM